MNLFLIVIYLSCSLVKCTQFTNCPTSPSCVSVPVSYQCRDTSGSANTLQWRVLNATGGLHGFSQYSFTASVGRMTSIGTQFTTNLTSRAGGSIVSNITFTATMDINNYTVACDTFFFDSATLSFTPVGTDSCSILIQGILPAPTPNELSIDPNYFSFSWTPQPASPCFSSYIVFVNSSVSNVTYTTTDTSLSLPVPSTNDTEYSISVAAVDTGGRYMSSIGMRMFTPDVPPAVNDFAVNQTYSDDEDIDDDDIVNITVSWNEPLSSSRPNVSSYIIYHDIPDPDTNMTIPVPTTTYNIPDATVGSVYTVGVAAVNVLGAGPIVSATISISSIVVPTTTSVLSSNIIVTPSSSPTPMDDNTAGGLDSTLYIGIGAGVAVIVIVMLIILIIVGYLIWCKLWKGKQENTADTVIYDTIPMDTPTNAVPNVPVTMNAPTDTVQVPGIPVSMNTAYGTATGVVHTTQNVAYTRSTGNTN